MPDRKTVVVAHSLGAVTALRVLAAAARALGARWSSVGGRLTRPVEELPELDGFLATDVDVERVSRRIGKRAVICSDVDPFVPSASDELAKRFDAQLKVQPGAGLFMVKDGVTSLPVVLYLFRSR
jgi:predicted alpha/beta hydrolase family esterase